MTVGKAGGYGEIAHGSATSGFSFAAGIGADQGVFQGARLCLLRSRGKQPTQQRGHRTNDAIGPRRGKDSSPAVLGWGLTSGTSLGCGALAAE
jgi:hypothetical protein